MSEELERARAFLRRTIDLTADESRSLEGGWLFRTPSLPKVWNLNHVGFWIAPPVAAVEQLVEQQLPGLPYTHVVIEHEPSAAALQPELRQHGFRFERELVMILRPRPPGPHPPRPPHRPDREPEAHEVIEPAESEMLELIRRWVNEERRTDRAEVEQLVECARREGRARGERRFGIRDDRGRLAAMTKLRSDGATAQVEDVFTAPEARGRGYARTLVTYATRLAVAEAHELVFIVADDNNWPKLLYERIGFEPAGRTWTFHRAGASRDGGTNG